MVKATNYERPFWNYEGVSKSFRTGRLERELQTVQLSAMKYNCIAILWVSLVSFTAIILFVASQRVFVFVVCFVIDSVRKLLDAPWHISEFASRVKKKSFRILVWIAVYPAVIRPGNSWNKIPLLLCRIILKWNLEESRLWDMIYVKLIVSSGGILWWRC